MFRTRTRIEESTNDSIIFAIVTGNLLNLKNLISSRNVDNILDTATNFASLQYAITSPNINNEIIKFLLQLGADPKRIIKVGDSFDLAISYNKRYLFEYFNKIQDDKIETLTDKIDILKGRVLSLEDANNYLHKSFDNLNDKITKLNNDIKQKDVQINNLKRKNEDTELAFNNLLKKVKK
jgi:hypothetical protein